MIRSYLIVTLVTATVLIFFLSVEISLAQDNDHDQIVFTGCPPSYVSGSHCDSIFYQVVAVHIDDDKSNPKIRYHLVSGPGKINEKTGLWVFHPEFDGRMFSPHQIEIAASYGNDTTSSEDNCRFLARVYDSFPRFSSNCGTHEIAMPEVTTRVPMYITDPDICDEYELSIFDIIPMPIGSIEYSALEKVVIFTPDIQDSGQTFQVIVLAESNHRSFKCTLFFDTFEPDPIRVRIDQIEDALPGDTVRLNVWLDQSPVDFDRVDLTLKYDPGFMQFIRGYGGPDLFMDSSGRCNGEVIVERPELVCYNWHDPVLLAISARAGIHNPYTEPACTVLDTLPNILATLEFVMLENFSSDEKFAPVDFYWCQCNSNLLFSAEEHYPSAVFNADGSLIEPNGMLWRSGVNDSCFYNPNRIRPRSRQVEYYNGGIHLSDSYKRVPYSINIGLIPDQIQGLFVDVPITLESIDTANGIGGFDLLIAYDATALSFQRALPGELYDECGWEYFTYRFGSNGNCDSTCPSGLVRVISIAETNNGPNHPNPGCQITNPGYVNNLPVTLAKMRFLVSNDRTLACQFIPIDFFWVDCGDNTITNTIGRELYLSASIYKLNLINNYWDTWDTIEVSDGSAGFPTYLGAQDECVYVDPNNYRSAIRNIDFYNGGLEIAGDCNIDATGDINLNGLSYEIADLVMYINFFIDGLSAFGNHIAGSIAASDVNFDGLTLSIPDLVFMTRIVNDDADPTVIGSNPLPDPARFTIDYSSGIVSVHTPDSLGAVLLKFSGAKQPTLLQTHMAMKWTDSVDSSNVIVYSTIAGNAIHAGELISFTGNGELIYVETAAYSGRLVNSIIDNLTDVTDDRTQSLPTDFALRPNYPNPFNPTTTIEYDIPQRSHVEIVIFNITGQNVRTIEWADKAAGQHSVVWDGRDYSGNEVSSGIYIYRLSTGSFTQSRKMLLLK